MEEKDWFDQAEADFRTANNSFLSKDYYASVFWSQQSIEKCLKAIIIKEKQDDNRILECAAEVKADFLISGDKKHLLPLKKFRGIKIVSARELIKRMFPQKENN